MLKVVFFGNSQSAFSNRHFQPLLEAPCKISAVVDIPPSARMSTNPAEAETPSFVEAARRAGTPTFEPPGPNRPEFVETIRKLSPDLFLCAGYTFVLKEEILSVPEIMAVNFHASLLPAYRGKHPVFWALRNGERRAGLTVHAMDAGVDTGRVLYQVKLRTREDDSVASLYDRIMDKSVGLVGRLIRDAQLGRLRPVPQGEEGASYYSSVDEEDMRLHWSWDAEKLSRRITITPGRCFCEVAGRRVFFIDARVVLTEGAASPGKVCRIDRVACTIAAGKDALRTSRAIFEGEEVSTPDLCRRLGLREGDSLC